MNATKQQNQSDNRRRRTEQARDDALYFAFGGLSPQDAVDHIRAKYDLGDFAYHDTINRVTTRLLYVNLGLQAASRRPGEGTFLIERFPWFVDLQGHTRLCIETSDAKLYATTNRDKDEHGPYHRVGDCYLAGLIGVKGQQIFHDLYDDIIERAARLLDPPEKW
jgi:hypothetical protein